MSENFRGNLYLFNSAKVRKVCIQILIVSKCFLYRVATGPGNESEFIF